MSADTSHGGQTTAEFNGWHASLHVNYTSSYHPVDLRIFEIDHLSVALTSPVFMSRMDVPSQTNALRSIANILQEAYRNALDSAATITMTIAYDNANQTPEGTGVGTAIGRTIGDVVTGAGV